MGNPHNRYLEVVPWSMEYTLQHITAPSCNISISDLCVKKRPEKGSKMAKKAKKSLFLAIISKIRGWSILFFGLNHFLHTLLKHHTFRSAIQGAPESFENAVITKKQKKNFAHLLGSPYFRYFRDCTYFRDF